MTQLPPPLHFEGATLMPWPSLALTARWRPMQLPLQCHTS